MTTQLQILTSEKTSGEKITELSLHEPICFHMTERKNKGHFWKPILEDAFLLVLQENLELKEQLNNSGVVSIPVLGVVK